MSAVAGRSCPAHYRHAPGALAHAPLIAADAAWVAGGLYGNLEALRAIDAMVAAERAAGRRAALVYNGDFHWFDADPADFRAVQRAVLAEHALAGNVELELADPDPLAGCGCAYPEFVGDATVDRSNRIIERLRADACGEAALRSELAALPRLLRVSVAGAVTGVVHGDPESLAGWQLAFENVARTPAPEMAARVRAWARDAGVDAFACAHTCLPWAGTFGSTIVINNGSAGMPNFRGDLRGVVTRIAPAAQPHPDALYALERAGVRWEAVAVDYDTAAWQARFLRAWPAGSAAHESYFERIAHGPEHDRTRASAAASALHSRRERLL